jgi:tetratricopeptide (TPR) repeat protein
LPLAVRIAGGRLARLPHRPLSWLAERLADDRRRLDEFRLEDLEVRASLDWSYRALTPPAARLLGRLAALDATPVSGWVASALLDLDPDEAEEHLDSLVDAHLVEVAGSARYALHDLVRAYGRERAAQDDDPTELTAALHRALAGWLARAQAAAGALGHRLIGADPGPIGVVVADPGGWFDTERAALVASVRQAHTLGADRLCWEVACHLSGYFELRNLHDDWHDTHRIALAAAERSGDDRGAGLIRHAVGELYANRDDYEQALAQLNRAAELLAGHGDRLAEANVLRSLGVAQRMTGDIDGARSSLESALSVFVEHRDEAGVAHVQHGLGAIHREQGRLDEAAKSYRDSLAYFEATDDRFTASLYRCSLGVVLRLLGRLAEAEECFRRSLELCRTIGNPPGKAYALGYLGDLKTDQGEHGVARRMLDASRSLAVRLGDQFAVALADRGLGRLFAATGDRDAARAAYTSALDLLTELDLPLWRGRTLEAIGDLDGDPAAWAAALELYRRVAAPEAAALEAKLS